MLHLKFLFCGLDVRTGPSDSVFISPRHSCKASPVVILTLTEKRLHDDKTDKSRQRICANREPWSAAAPWSRPSLPTDVASPAMQTVSRAVNSREHVRIQAQRAAPPNTPASAATRSESAPLLPDRDALCDLHGACRTDAAASQAQQGQLAAQPSTTRTMPRAASVDLPRPAPC